MKVGTVICCLVPYVLLCIVTVRSKQFTGIIITCETNADCKKNEFCDKGSCHCRKGYIGYMDKCFPIRNWGEECLHDRQCNNSRMICTNYENDVQQKMFCYCDPYHLWNSTTRECLEIGNLTEIAGNFREVYNVTGMIEKSAQKVFLGVVVAGLIFVCILLSFIGICSIYGCCQSLKKGRYGGDAKNKDQINEVAVIGLPAGTYDAIDTDFGDMGVI